MKSKSTELIGNALWDCLQSWISANQKRGKSFLGVKIQKAYKDYAHKFVTFRLTKVLK